MTVYNSPTSIQRGEVPDGYEQVLFWKATGSTARLIALQVTGAVLFILFSLVFVIIARLVGGLPDNFTLKFGVEQIFWLLAGGALVLILHELVHGLAMRLFGAAPKYGVLPKQLMFYATSPGFAYPRNSYLVVILAPLVVLSVLAVAGMAVLKGMDWVLLLALLAAVNASGAVGDMWIAWIVCRYPAAAYVMDEKDGMKILGLPR